jgi:hypothetical protein
LPIRGSISRSSGWITGGLVLALATVGVLGGLLYADRRQSTDERAAAATALAWARAIDRNDRASVPQRDVRCRRPAHVQRHDRLQQVGSTRSAAGPA